MKVKFLGKRKKIVHVVRFVKAVSTVIAVLLMIAIAVIASLVAYFWVTGYFKSTSTKISKAIQIQSAYYTGQYLGVYVQNIGQGKATLIAHQCLYVDGALRTSASVNPDKLQQISYTLQESDIALVVDAISLNLGQTIKIKIVTSEGTFVEYSFTVNTFQGQNPYSLALIADPPAGGSVAANNNGPYHYGDVVQLTATANSGWGFSGWSGDASGSTNPTSIVINGTNTVNATFTQNEYALTLNVVGGGSVSKLPDQATYHYGDHVQLLATGASGWVFSGWSGDLTGTTNPSSVAIDETPEVTATFVQTAYALTVNVNPLGSGSVSLNNTGPYYYGDVVQLTANPTAGWSFSDWSQDLTGSANPTTILIDGDKTVTAAFTQNTYTLAVNAVGQGSVSLNYSGPYHYGDVVELTANPTAGWSFSDWSQDLTGSANPTTILIDGDKAVTATFVQTAYALAVNVNPLGSGSVSLNNSGPYHYGDVVELTANPTAGWSFSDWSGDASGSANPTTITIDGDKTVTATFTQIEYTLTVGTIGNGAGTVTKTPDQATYHYGDNVQLNAAANAGSYFAGWSGDLSGTTNPISIMIDGNKMVSATFSVTVVSSVSVSPPTAAITAGGTQTYTAIASDAYGNSWDVTGSATWSITSGAGGSWLANVYTSAKAGTWTVTGSYSGKSGTAQLTVNAAAASKLVYIVGAGQSITRSTYSSVIVSSVITVQLQDASGNPISAGAGGVVVSLSTTSSNGRFYSDSAGNNRITSRTIASGASSASFYYSDYSQGTPTLTASSGGLTSATTQFTINNYYLSFQTGGGQTLATGQVSSSITVRRYNYDGSSYYYNAPAITVALTTNSSGGHFSANSDGSGSITSIAIGSGSSTSSTFYYVDSAVGTPVLTASSAGYTSGQTTFTIRMPVLVFSAGAPQTLTAGSVSARITVQRQDGSGNAYAPNTAITVGLASSSVTGVFYSDVAGTQVITQISIASGADHAYIYYKDTAVGSPTLTASSTTAGYTSATTTFTIRMPILVFSAGTPQVLTAGSISARITVQRQDGSGNAYSPNTAITVDLASSSGSGVFYSDVAGTQVITQISIASGADHAYIYYKDTAVGSPTLTASSTGYTPATTTFMILASGAKLVFTAGAGQTLTASTVSSVITVQLQDAGGNPISAGAGGVVVSLSTTSSNGRFYLDSAGNNRITSVTIASGASSASFYYWDSSAGTPTLTASSGSLTPATMTFTINSYYLGFRTGGAQTLATGQVSSSITVRRYNPDGSSYSGTTAITVALTTSSSSGHFSANSDGSGSITSIAIGSGSSTSAMFYYVDSAVGTPVLTASSAGYTSGQTTFTITGSASKLVFTAGTSQSLYTNTVSSVITVQRQDAAGYGVTSGGSITVSLAKTSTTGSFYANSGGTGGAITQITIASGASSANFYYEDTAAGSSTITASYTGLTSATTTFTITLNQVPNGGFESPGVWTTGGTGYATSQDTDETNIPLHSGIFAELDSAYQTATEYGSLINTFSPAIALSSIPNTAGSLSTWVYNNGHNGVAVGYYSFQIALTASDGTQLIYWWGNTPANAPTETATTKVINMGTLPGMFTVGQWIQFSRNLLADWASKGLSPSTSITSITIRNDGYYSGGNQYGQEIFIDNVQIQ